MSANGSARRCVPESLLPWLVITAAHVTQAAAADKCQIAAAEVNVTMEDSHAHIPAKINGAAVSLILDSGAFWSVLSPAVAEELKLPQHMAPYGLQMEGIGGTSQVSIARVKSLEFSQANIKEIEFIVGGSDMAGMTTGGILGENLLERFDVEYDFANGKVRLIQPKNCGKAMLAYWAKSGDQVSVLDIDRTDVMAPFAMASAYLNGAKIKVLFDTGAWTSMITRRAAEHSGFRPDGPNVIDAGFSRGVGRKVVKSYIAPFEELKFGDGETVRHTRLRVADTDLGREDMLIGADFFLSHHVMVANSQHKIYFTYNGGPVFNLTARAPTPQDEHAVEGGEPAPAANATPAAAALPNADAYSRRGAGWEGRHDLPRALQDFNRAVELEPNNPEYYFRRGRVRWEMQDAGAIQDFDRVMQLQPNHIPGLMLRAELRIGRGDSADARADLDKVDELAAKQANVRLQVAFLYDDIGAFEAAMREYDGWIASHGDDSMLARAYSGRCRDRTILGTELAAALKDCNKAESLSTKGADAGVLKNRGLLRLRLGDYDKAIADFDGSLKLRPRDADALYGRGLAKLRQQKTASGQADLASAKEIAPKIEEKFNLRGLQP